MQFFKHFIRLQSKVKPWNIFFSGAVDCIILENWQKKIISSSGCFSFKFFRSWTSPADISPPLPSTILVVFFSVSVHFHSLKCFARNTFPKSVLIPMVRRIELKEEKKGNLSKVGWDLRRKPVSGFILSTIWLKPV